MDTQVLNREMKQMINETHESNQPTGLMQMIKKRRDKFDSRTNSLSF
jgi:hypothetical protein